ncbi:hypothetical protein TWF506_003774 [Arthrobotrys conoides]|uniref:Uncharacterized protein n=1 Tax=Arthrobotrys conoides TaxID=74498 RepID=A0AAN8RK50_9PEZI
MPWSTPPPLLLHHRNPPFPSLHIQHSLCEHTTPLTASQTTILNLPNALTSSRLILHTVSKCGVCLSKELEKDRYVVEYKPCVNNNVKKKEKGGYCEERVLKGEGGRCWVCVFKGEVEGFMRGEEYRDMVKL